MVVHRGANHHWDGLVSGVGLGVAALVECPLKRIGWGNLRDPALAGAVITDTGTELAAPAALRLADPAAGIEGFSCGDLGTLVLGEENLSRFSSPCLLLCGVRCSYESRGCRYQLHAWTTGMRGRFFDEK